MVRQYSIAEARRNLPSVVNAAQAGAEVQLTRNGRPVAVLVSVDEYERLRHKRVSFEEAFKHFREEFPEKSTGLSRQYFSSLRDRSSGRKAAL